MTTIEAEAAANIRMGTVDRVLGVLAEVIRRLYVESNVSPVNLPVSDIYNILHQMQMSEEFREDLCYLDFDRIGEDSYSEALENLLFQAGTWGLLKARNPAVGTIGLEMEMAEKRLDRMRREYGADAMGRMEQMAARFLEIYKERSEESGIDSTASASE